jgi:hypothetical protein
MVSVIIITIALDLNAYVLSAIQEQGKLIIINNKDSLYFELF